MAAVLLQGLADRLTDELRLRVWVAEDPLTCVARGAGMVFENFDTLSRYLVGLERGSTRHTRVMFCRLPCDGNDGCTLT